MRGSKSRIACADGALEIGHVERRRRLPDSAGRPKLITDRRAYGSVAAIHARLEPRRVEQPREIAQHRFAQAPLRHHALLARLELLVRLVVGEAIQQRRLQPILGRELSAMVRAGTVGRRIAVLCDRERANLQERTFRRRRSR